MHALDYVLTNEVSAFLDAEFDKVARFKSGEINDAALDRTGFKWAVKKVQERLGVKVDEARRIVIKVGWF